MIKETLKEFGFTEKEIEVYLEALRLGKATPARIAYGTGINRATVYTLSRVMIKKGILTEDLGGKTLYLVPLLPRDLGFLVERERKSLETKARLLNETIKELSELPSSTHYSLPKIKFVEESSVADFLKQNTLKWKKSSAQADSTWWGFRDHTFAEEYGEWIHWTWQEEMKKPAGLKLKLLANPLEASTIDKEINEKGYEGREVLPWKGQANFGSSTFIAGDYIIMAVTNERPFYLIEIYNPILARDLSNVFKENWKRERGANQ